MLRSKHLYLATIAMVLFGIATSVALLIHSTKPSADVLAKFDATHPQLTIADFIAGEPRIIVRNQVSIIAWRRDAEEISLATAQETRTGQAMIRVPVSDRQSNQTTGDTHENPSNEWFFAWAFSPGGSNCHVMLQAGDYNGFFDPCRGSHFDLNGRIRKGPSNTNLLIIPFEQSKDGQSIQLDLTNIPKTSH